jgi:outer membrane protein assembly factor BamB
MFSAADEHTIYFEADQLQTIVAVGASDGQERWRTPLSNSLVPQSPIRFIAPPVVSDGMVFISASASASAAYSENPPGVLVFALHADTGALAWSLPIKGINANEQAQLLTARQGVLFVELPTGNLVALRGSDGTQLWSAPDSTSGGNPSVVTDGVVSFLQYQHIVALDAPTGKLLWSYPVDDQVTTAFRNPLGIGASSVYVSSNRFINNTAVQYLISLNAQTGNVQWTYQTNFESTGASVTEAGNLVYYAHGSYLDAMRTSNGQRVWRYSAAPNLGFGTPVVVDGVLYVSSNIGSSHTIVMCFGDCPPSTAIYALNASTGAVYWRYASEAIDTSVPPWVTNSAN